MAYPAQCVALRHRALACSQPGRCLPFPAISVRQCPRLLQSVLPAPVTLWHADRVQCRATASGSKSQPSGGNCSQAVRSPRWLAALVASTATLWALPSPAMEMADEVMAATAGEDLDTSSIVLLMLIVVAVRLAVQSAIKEEEDQDPSHNQQQPDNSWQDMTRANVRTVVDPRNQQGTSSSRPILSMYDMEKNAMAAAAARSVAGSVREARRQIAALKIEQKLRPGLMNEGRQLTGYPGAEYLAMMMDGYLTTTKSSLSRQVLVQQLSDQALGQCVLRMVAEIAALDQVNCLVQAAHKTEKQSHNWVRSTV